MRVTAIERNIQDIEVTGAMGGVDIANVVDVSKATVSCWRSGTKRPRPESQKILSDLAYVVRRFEGYYSSDKVHLGSTRLIPSSMRKGQWIPFTMGNWLMFCKCATVLMLMGISSHADSAEIP